MAQRYRDAPAAGGEEVLMKWEVHIKTDDDRGTLVIPVPVDFEETKERAIERFKDVLAVAEHMLEFRFKYHETWVYPRHITAGGL
jgi:hypothetical protein